MKFEPMGTTMQGPAGAMTPESSQPKAVPGLGGECGGGSNPCRLWWQQRDEYTASRDAPNRGNRDRSRGKWCANYGSEFGRFRLSGQCDPRGRFRPGQHDDRWNKRREHNCGRHDSGGHKRDRDGSDGDARRRFSSDQFIGHQYGCGRHTARWVGDDRLTDHRHGGSRNTGRR